MGVHTCSLYDDTSARAGPVYGDHLERSQKRIEYIYVRIKYREIRINMHVSTLVRGKRTKERKEGLLRINLENLYATLRYDVAPPAIMNISCYSIELYDWLIRMYVSVLKITDSSKKYRIKVRKSRKSFAD